MSAVPGGVGPVSVRYATQIREMLFAQAVDRMAAEQEAARAAAEAERVERLKPVEPVAAEADPRPAPPAKPEPEPEPQGAKTPAQLLDIQV